MEARVVPIEDDDEIEYGKLYVHDLKDSGLHRPTAREDIWPLWSDGVPTRLRLTAFTPAFWRDKVHHKARPTQLSLELRWSAKESENAWNCRVAEAFQQPLFMVPLGKPPQVG
jgi:hypothetical protein